MLDESSSSESTSPVFSKIARYLLTDVTSTMRALPISFKRRLLSYFFQMIRQRTSGLRAATISAAQHSPVAGLKRSKLAFQRSPDAAVCRPCTVAAAGLLAKPPLPRRARAPPKCTKCTKCTNCDCEFSLFKQSGRELEINSTRKN